MDLIYIVVFQTASDRWYDIIVELSLLSICSSGVWRSHEERIHQSLCNKSDQRHQTIILYQYRQLHNGRKQRRLQMQTNLQKCKQIIFAVTGFHSKIVIIRGHNDFRRKRLIILYLKFSLGQNALNCIY
jgi:hypothetical protein